jgi:NAD(P)-dependent dehydrogenase (short-subunit alcohol dehydrogenase family)
MTTVLITGASRGIGLELARVYVQRGDRVIAAAREPSRAEALAMLAKETGRITILAFDVTDTAALAAAAKRIADTPIDLVVANAGIIGPRGAWNAPEQTAAVWTDVLATNVIGAFFTAQAFIPHLQATRGKLALISSIMGSTARSPGGSYAYRASKAAVTNIAANLAAELKPSGVAVGAYHPGWVRTDMGGSGADIAVADSAAGLVARFDHLSLATSGVFEDYRGQPIAF